MDDPERDIWHEPRAPRVRAGRIHHHRRAGPRAGRGDLADRVGAVMPDITMCGSVNCTVRQTCYRNPHSGTQPSEWRQSWFAQVPGENQHCLHYWPKTDSTK